MVKDYIVLSEITCLREASSRTLATMLDDIYAEKKVEGLNFENPKKHVVYGADAKMYNPSPTHISKELFNAMVDNRLIALKENVANPYKSKPPEAVAAIPSRFRGLELTSC